MSRSCSCTFSRRMPLATRFLMSTYVAVRWFIDEEHNQSSKFLRCTFAWRKHARSRYKDDVCEIVFSEDLTLANRCGSDRESHLVVSSHALFRLNLRRKTYFTSLNCKQFAKTSSIRRLWWRIVAALRLISTCSFSTTVFTAALS